MVVWTFKSTKRSSSSFSSHLVSIQRVYGEQRHHFWGLVSVVERAEETSVDVSVVDRSSVVKRPQNPKISWVKYDFDREK
jgi:hypothetical protein